MTDPENSENPQENENKPEEFQPIGPEQDEATEENYEYPPKQITPVISPVAAGFIGLVGGFFLYQIVGGVLTFLILGFDIENAPVNGVRLMTAAGQILFILLPALMFSKWFYEDVTEIIRFHKTTLKETGLFLLGSIVLTPLLQYYLTVQTYFFDKLAESYPFFEWLKSMLDSLNELIEKTFGNLLYAGSIPEGMLVIFVIAVVPALCEEVMFRGFIQRSFEFKMKPFRAALLTAVFFGLYHFNPYGILPLIGLGLYFGWAAYMSNSIFVPIVLHFVNNFSAVIIYFIFGDDDLINTAGDSGADLTSSLLFVIILLMLFFGIIFYIKKYYKERTNK
jgi:membrane protease YdiL (CAAX protease family)